MGSKIRTIVIMLWNFTWMDLVIPMEVWEGIDNINVGNRITHINDIQIDDYFEKYMLAFYAGDDSKFSQKVASIYSFIVNGNRYVPISLQLPPLLMENWAQIGTKICWIVVRAFSC